MLAEHRSHRAFGDVADDAIDRLTTLEENQAGDARDLVLSGDGGVLVRIQFDELRFAGVCGCDLLDDRPEHAARPAPRCPEIYENRLAAVQHFGLEVGLRNLW